MGKRCLENDIFSGIEMVYICDLIGASGMGFRGWSAHGLCDDVERKGQKTPTRIRGQCLPSGRRHSMNGGD